MTDDASPENLRKFLESDDPAMIGMGLSMAKGSTDTSRETLGLILGLYTFHGDKEIRSLAKTAFTKLAPPVPRGIVKKYWQAEFRNQSWVWEGWIQELVSELEKVEVSPVFILTTALRTKNKNTETAIQIIGNFMYDSMSGQMCTESNSDDYGKILFRKTGPKRNFPNVEVDAIVVAMINAVNSSIHSSYGQMGWGGAPVDKARMINIVTAIEILGEFRDLRAVDTLIKALTDKRIVNESTRALRIIGDKRAVEPIIKVMEHTIVDRRNRGYHLGWSRTHTARWRDLNEFAKALGKMGNLESIKPLVMGLGIESKYRATPLVDSEKTSVMEAISKILERAKISSKERTNIIRFLTSEDASMSAMGFSMLKGLTNGS